MNKSLSAHNEQLQVYSDLYSGLCPSPLYSPVISLSSFVRVHESASELNLSVVEWQWVYSCVSYDGQIVR